MAKIASRQIRKLHDRRAQVGSTLVHTWMFPYVLGYRDKVPYFNVKETLIGTQKALLFIEQVRLRNGTFLLANTQDDLARLVKKTATLTKQPFVDEFWCGGLLTNWKQVRKSVIAFGFFERFMAPLLLKERNFPFLRYWKSKQRFGGVQNMRRMPDVLIMLQARTSYRHILDEARRLAIPIICCIDTYSPNVVVEYPIPVNVHSIAFSHFFCRLLVKVWTYPRKLDKIVRKPHPFPRFLSWREKKIW
jgi:small subunit ribosomal protein S2